ncbi:N-acetylneuraminate synthase [Pseudomonas asplenii]|uniref:N-acetylneuraminate synthase n=1 Tax=Pseudomonas asplenii TaxID=53407 RepID=A0A1H1W324_9PSED|nr:pseudaminic acid synthase [Pseudomonas asplenii]SDS90896.1 N-acetylneuraminate synthase [Pseudomonas asplenii]
MTSFKIGQRVIGPDAPPFVIAEMSGNHNQSLEVALQIVEAAAKAGAHALKLQTYTADTMTLDLAEGEFFIKDPGSLWAGSSLYELYEKAHTPWEWHAPIFARAKALGMLAFSTPFDETAVDFLESLDVPAYKIASFENTDLPLIRRVAATGKPLIISTGMASVAELDETVRAARAAGCRDLVLLKCTSTYPASPLNSHIRTIAHLQQLFGCQVGLSDHSMGVGVAVAAVALGATVVEKHFTLDRAAGGVDASFSLEPAELASLVVETERAWQALGQVRYGATEAEQKSLVYRRSLYVVQDVAKGEPFTAQNVRAIRPGLGLAPKHVDAVLGRNARVALKRGTPLVWSAIE